MPPSGRSGGAPDLLVVGGGAWGSWTALLARKLGASVTLMEAAEPGHRDSTSGDYSRIFRHAHGEDELLLGWARKSLAAWKALGAMSGEELFVESGVAWCVSDLGLWEAESERRLRAAGVPHERISADEAVKRWPAMSPAALASVLYEPTAGFLRAANGVRAASRAFTQAGGTLVQGRARPAADGSALDASGIPIPAGAVVWAAGSSLPGLFPDLVGADTPAEITPVRRDVAYFDVKGMSSGEIPTWIDAGIGVWGIPNESGHGAKVGP
ncbi:MAG: FAD-dependent oxidoreductase, partial [Candidatus Limnocylindrus sp.]